MEIVTVIRLFWCPARAQKVEMQIFYEFRKMKIKFGDFLKICENSKFHDFISKWAPGRKTYINISISIGFWGPETVIFLEFTTFGGFYDISHFFQKRRGIAGIVRKMPTFPAPGGKHTKR